MTTMFMGVRTGVEIELFNVAMLEVLSECDAVVSHWTTGVSALRMHIVYPQKYARITSEHVSPGAKSKESDD